MAIYVKFAEESKPKTVREFLHKFLVLVKTNILEM
jgi:hypothetical protein